MKKKFMPIEDIHDLAIINQRKNEEIIPHREMIKVLRQEGLLQHFRKMPSPHTAGH